MKSFSVIVTLFLVRIFLITNRCDREEAYPAFCQSNIDRFGASIAVHDVHSHELYIDSLDNLYGEHLWYNGETLKTWAIMSGSRFESENGEDHSPTNGLVPPYFFISSAVSVKPFSSAIAKGVWPFAVFAFTAAP